MSIFFLKLLTVNRLDYLPKLITNSDNFFIIICLFIDYFDNFPIFETPDIQN